MELSRIFWDTNLVIYLIEGSGELAARTKAILARMSERRDTLVTSTLTLGEALTKPMADRDTKTIDRYERFLISPGIQLVEFDQHAARIYATLRGDKTIRPADAVQLSCAATARVNMFITNDDRLSKKLVPGVDFVVPLARAFL